MIAPDDALARVREQLRKEVLGQVRDPYARSVLVAALGVLSELGRRVVVADAWCEPSVRAFRAAAPAWAERATVRDDPALARRVAALLAHAKDSGTLDAERASFLEAAEAILTAQWTAEPARRDAELIDELRALVAADNALELAHLERRS